MSGVYFRIFKGWVIFLVGLGIGDDVFCEGCLWVMILLFFLGGGGWGDG